MVYLMRDSSVISRWIIDDFFGSEQPLSLMEWLMRDSL